MPQPDPSDHLSAPPAMATPDPGQGVMSQIADQAQSFGNSATSMASELTSAVKQRPYATLAIAAGLAFAIGAVWQLKARRRPQSHLEALVAQLAELAPSRQGVHHYLPRSWR